MKHLIIAALMITGLQIGHATELPGEGTTLTTPPPAAAEAMSASTQMEEPKSFFESRTLEDLQKMINIDGTVSEADATPTKGG